VRPARGKAFPVNDRHAGAGARPAQVSPFGQAAVARRGSGPTLVDLFDQAAAARPDAVAIEYAGATTSYTRLAAASRAVAAHLARLGVGPGDRVAVQLEPGAELIAALLAVLRRGAAYVPLDAQRPPSRNRLILDDANPRAVIGDVRTAPGRPPATLTPADLSTLIDAVAAQTHPAEPASAATCRMSAPFVPTSNDLCCVIYTSGATGRAEAIPIRHRDITALFEATGSLFDLTPDDAWLLYHSVAADLSAWELWGALLHGARLVVADPWTKLCPDACADLVLVSGVTVLHQTPTEFATLNPAIIDRVQQGARITLRYVVLGGAPFAPESLGPWVDTFGLDHIPIIINMYSPTGAAAVHPTCRRVTAADLP
jgi:non-ribosomal peptide synthetase component F